MDAALNRRSLWIGVPGIALEIAGLLPQLVWNVRPTSWIGLGGLVVQAAGVVLLVWGLALYARAKGHSPWWGLMGLLSILGVNVLAVLPDRLKRAAPP